MEDTCIFMLLFLSMNTDSPTSRNGTLLGICSCPQLLECWAVSSRSGQMAVRRKSSWPTRFFVSLATVIVVCWTNTSGAERHVSCLFFETVPKPIAEDQVTKVGFNLLQWQYYMQNLSCDCCNHLVKPVRIHNYSETHLPFVAAKQTVELGCGWNNRPCHSLVSDGGLILPVSLETPHGFGFIISELLFGFLHSYNPHSSA